MYIDNESNVPISYRGNRGTLPLMESDYFRFNLTPTISNNHGKTISTNYKTIIHTLPTPNIFMNICFFEHKLLVSKSASMLSVGK